jgi:hypothetical protein
MASQIYKTLVLFTVLSFPYQWVFSQSASEKLNFKTTNGLSVSVHNDAIFVENKRLYDLHLHNIIYSSKRNRLLEDHGTAFLFLEDDGSPNLDRLLAFRIAAGKVDSVADAISSDIRDIDGDSYLEFGGRDLNEVHPSEDSMYYIPFDFYEIRNGKIQYDSAFSKAKDIWVNGVYLSDSHNPADFTILKPGIKSASNIPLNNPPILRERIDGPANVRDKINGKILFRLMDNVPVFTADSSGKWFKIALEVDLSEDEYKSHFLAKDTRIFMNGREVGKTMDRLNLEDVYSDTTSAGYRGYNGQIAGYTSVKNIKEQSLPENCLCQLIAQNNTLTTEKAKDYIVGFRFAEGRKGRFKDFQLDDGFVEGPYMMLRLDLIFFEDKLIAVVHRRNLVCQNRPVQQLKRGYNLTIVGSQNPALIEEFIKEFNSFITHAD